MNLSSLKPAEGSVKKGKGRIGRGEGSGRGGTSTRGHKGAQSRSGYSRKIGFEGGQMPLQRRIPKRGFKNVNRKEYVALNLMHLEYFAEKFNTDTITVDFLKENNIIQKFDNVKVLANGELTKKLNVTAHAISKTAQEALEKLGGTFTKL